MVIGAVAILRFRLRNQKLQGEAQAFQYGAQRLWSHRRHFDNQLARRDAAAGEAGPDRGLSSMHMKAAYSRREILADDAYGASSVPHASSAKAHEAAAGSGRD